MGWDCDADKCYTATRVPGGMLMAGYRLYFMDRFSGHIEHRREFEATDDGEAMAIASKWSTGQPMELWLGAHKLKRWEEGARASVSSAEQSERA
jgi:hypothetical protein